MPISKIDSNEALAVIAAELAATTGVPESVLLQDPKRLDAVLMEVSKFNWERVGKQMDQTRQQMYRWYHDTHQRKLFGGVSQDDIQLIKHEIERAMDRNEQMDLDFQKVLKQQLSREYHRNSFTVAFNNQKRLLLARGHKKAGSFSSVISASQDSKSMQSLEIAPLENKEELFPDMLEEQDSFPIFDYFQL